MKFRIIDFHTTCGIKPKGVMFGTTQLFRSRVEIKLLTGSSDSHI
jgi:hypothetical protein